MPLAVPGAAPDHLRSRASATGLLLAAAAATAAAPAVEVTEGALAEGPDASTIAAPYLAFALSNSRQAVQPGTELSVCYAISKTRQLMGRSWRLWMQEARQLSEL